VSRTRGAEETRPSFCGGNGSTFPLRRLESQHPHTDRTRDVAGFECGQLQLGKALQIQFYRLPIEERNRPKSGRGQVLVKQTAVDGVDEAGAATVEPITAHSLSPRRGARRSWCTQCVDRPARASADWLRRSSSATQRGRSPSGCSRAVTDPTSLTSIWGRSPRARGLRQVPPQRPSGHGARSPRARVGASRSRGQRSSHCQEQVNFYSQPASPNGH
jgi:hypothetical protein